MTIIKDVMIATDGSENINKAVEYALDIAKLANAKVHALYVVDTAAFASIPMDAAWESMYEILHEEGHEAVASIQKMAEEMGLFAEGIVIEGHPAREIVEQSVDRGMNMIIMGTTGKTGWNRLVLGSVAAKVSQTSSIPVMVVRSDNE
ncbi:MAG: universal stress protein [Methanosarcinales archaeon]|nr:universal stress protein [Methanosarcinales archaeon]